LREPTDEPDLPDHPPAIGCALPSPRDMDRIIEWVPNPLLIVDETGAIMTINGAALQLLDYARDEIVGHPVEILVPDWSRVVHQQVPDRLERPATAGRPMGAACDRVVVAKGQHAVPVEIGLARIDADASSLMMVSMIDLSLRKIEDERLRIALREKCILLEEVHHRVKNNLQIISSLLSLQAAHLEDRQAVQALTDSQRRIHAMALIHRVLYRSPDVGQVHIGQFLEELAPSLMSAYTTGGITVDMAIEATDLLLPISTAIPCGLIVNELMSNALKHAFPAGSEGTIRVSIAPGTPGRARLSISDNGLGLPEGLDIAAGGALGLQLVSLLTDQLGGSLEIQRSDPTRFVVDFPIGGPRAGW